MRRRAIASSLALIAVAVAVAPAAAGARLPAVLTQLKPVFQVRPPVISYTGDGTGIVGGTDGTSAKHPGHLHWTIYNRHRGVGHGLLWLDDCLPNCAQGKFHSTPVTAYVLSPKQNRFRRLTLKYTYKGKQYTDRRRIHYFRGIGGSPGYWAYDIVG